MFDMNEVVASPVSTQCGLRNWIVENYSTTPTTPEVPAETHSQLKCTDGKYRVCFYENGLLTSARDLIPCVTDVRSYENRVVIVTFSDGTEEKAVLHPDDKFSLETGVSICIAKKLAGGSSVYNKLVTHGMKQADAAKQREIDRYNDELESRKQREAKERRRQARQQKRERKQIGMMTEAIVKALATFMDHNDTNE